MAVPDETRIRPALVIVKLPVVSEPPFTSKPAIAGIAIALAGLTVKLPPTGIVIRPLVNKRLPPLVTVVVPLTVRVVFKLPLVILSSSKLVVPLMMAFEAPANSTIPLVPPM